MLYEILENPGVINRRAHKALYHGTSKEMELGNGTFNSWAGRGKKILSQTQIRSDLRVIEDVSGRIRQLVNKRIAHFSNPGELRQLPTFNELDNALEKLDKILCKYNQLLTASGKDSTFATRQYNWMEVLWEPWIRPGSKFHTNPK